MDSTRLQSEGDHHSAPHPWHTRDVNAVAGALETDLKGLSASEAARRLAHYGPNEVEAERETPWWVILAHQFLDPLIYILLIAAVVTALLQDYTDTAVILAVVLLNALIGFVQEFKARDAMRSLAQLTSPHAEVLRDGASADILSRDLVPGDVVLLASGARVPADLRLFQLRELEIDESALTGESDAVRKTIDALEEETLVSGDQTNMAFAGTNVTRGRGKGLVVRTGARTEIGQIAETIREMGETATPLQQKIERLGKWIGVVILVLVAIVVVVGLLRAMEIGDILITAVAMAVATIPEGLPVVLTVTLAVGVRRMARRNAIIRALPAVETLGSTTVIGSDKTGTLTRNEMTVRSIWAGGRTYEVTGGGYELEGAILHEKRPVSAEEDVALHRTLLSAVLASEADPQSVEDGEPHGDPTELALLVVPAKAALSSSVLKSEHTELDLLPFESDRRFMGSLNRGKNGLFIHIKGAPEAVLSRCSAMLLAGGEESALDADAIREAARDMAAQGWRVLATAFRPETTEAILEEDLEGDFIFAGLQAMEDPVRPEAITAVRDARTAGIRVLMLTGDHVATARAIGLQLGLGEEHDRAVEGHELSALSDEELDEITRTVNIYARVAPEHKLRIVQRLKAQGEIVAVTGDGVNDAPALRAAHLGVAMGKNGTDVAREASEMVLADDNFATITAAVEEGRVVFSNIRKVTFFLLSTGVAMPVTILFALFAGWPLPYLAAQILWINLVTNGLQDVALAFEPGEAGLLRRRPRPAEEGILTVRHIGRLFGVGTILATGTLLSFWWALDRTGDLDYARTVAVTQMVVFQFFHVLNSRSLDRSIFRIPPFSNRFLFISIMAAGTAQFMLLHVPFLQQVFRTMPLSPQDWGLILLVGTTVVIGGEIDKWRNRRNATPLG